MDAKKSDHAYPKHVKCFSWGHSSDSPFSSSAVLSGEQGNIVKSSLSSVGCLTAPVHNSSDTSLKTFETEGCHGEKEKNKTNGAVKRNFLADIPTECHDTPVPEYSGKGHKHFNFSQKKSTSVASVPTRLDGVDAHPRKQKPKKTNKPNNRETDHMYNTRKAETMDEVTMSKDNNKTTDHIRLRETRKVESTQETSKKPNNRDTDHLYNMRNAETLSQETTGSSKCSVRVFERRKRVRGRVDMRVVDNDHMYHDKIKKKRKKLDNKGRTKRSKSQSPGNTVTAVASKEKSCLPENTPKDQTYEGSLSHTTCAGDIILPANHKRTTGNDCTFDTKSNLMRTTLLNVESECEEKVCSVFMDGEILDPLSEHAYTSMQSKRSSILDSTSAVSISSGTTAECLCPDISDDDSDHISEDSNPRTGVFQTDHMYVHADYLGSLCETEGTVLAKCCSVEGYRQEHSYASSGEMHYDACVNCSELVQQLIGTIRQQRGHIDDLEQKLQIANAKNKYLSMLFSQQLEGVN